MNKQAWFSLIIFLFLLAGTAVVVLYARGYRLSFASGQPHLATSGILVTTSNPDGAEVLIDGRLTTATNNTINLTPDTYHVEIFKDGYFPWTKTITVRQEVVSKADVYLFPVNPALQGITALGALNPVVDPTGTKIAYTISSQSAKTKNGVYVLNMEGNLLTTLQSGSQQIADDTTDTLSAATLTWSPDGTQLIASLSASTATAKAPQYLLDATKMNTPPQDITETLFQTQAVWQQEKTQLDTARINALPAVLRTFAAANMNILSWSPDETKILYVATNSATLPPVVTPQLPDAAIVGQERTLHTGDLYVLDIKEDKNFRVNTGQTTAEVMASQPQWFSDDKHLVFVQNNQVQAIDIDGSNKLTLYAGPFDNSFAIPWPNGGRIVILTSLGNPTIQPNLYTLNLR